MPRYLTTLAIILNHRRYQETDQMITVLTPTMGKLSVSAKGTRSPKSHRQGSLELGSIIKAQLYEKNDRYWLAETSVVQHTLSTSKSLTQLNLIFYFLEIINQFIAENQHTDNAYSILSSLLASINHNEFSSLLKSEINLLEILGFGVPPEIADSYQNKDYPTCQKQIKEFLESILQKPLNSSQLFK